MRQMTIEHPHPPGAAPTPPRLLAVIEALASSLAQLTSMARRPAEPAKERH